MIRHRCFRRSISRKLAAAVMAVSLLAGQMLPVMAAEDAGASADDSQSVASSANDSAANDAASIKNNGASATEKEVTLRVCSWEEYIDEGGWDEDEALELDNGTTIFGENSMVEDFENWYYENYGVKVNVQYSCFGTNEDLYNMLTLGDVYDLVCPSEYMIMKLMSENKLEPLSDGFFDENNDKNYYINGVSPYIRDTFETHEINGETWSKYAAGFMFGITGILYNPEKMTADEAGTWTVLNNPKFAKQITIKDNVRDSYFAAVGALQRDKLMDTEFRAQDDYSEQLKDIMNDVSPETIAKSQDLLQDIKDNVYSFETDSGKADMITGKVVANYQWSGDAVYAMDQAEEDGVKLDFAVPEECTNLYFDGWVMLKNGIDGDADRKQAAEAFINFVSRPDNAVRNMYYIGYTSVIAGGDDDTVYSYLDYTYGAEDDEEDVVDYPLGYFFTGDNSDPDYVLRAPAEQVNRQLGAQYPSQDAIERSAVMEYFDEDATKDINQMWINIRCYNIKDVPTWAWFIVAAVIGALAGVIVYHKRSKKFYLGK
ncbi:extracellular solute-binding protein [Coprococcus eutactus ATCC 27759]|nr:extracellular solute-binding protein [Coprococcus eutactus]UEA81070.1 extracellular solute-binding protein [Coprococcus eutactus ATCC 27759]UWP18418.1 extracellular solute-binding protein [Coprococcus eutactus]